MVKRHNRSAPKSVSARTTPPQGTVTPTAQATPEDRRALVVRKLAEPGRQRIRLAAELQDLDHQIRPLVVQAVVAGVPYRRIAELSGISRATVSRWVKDSDPESLLNV